MKNPELDYIQSIINNDVPGLNTLYDEFLPKIKQFISKNGGSEEDALDIFQDALIIIYDKASNEEFSLSSKFYTLLYGICWNLWGNKLQKKSRQEVTLDADSKYILDEDWTQNFHKQERYNIYWSNFLKLKSDCQKILELFFDGYSMADIQHVMGLKSVGYAKKKKFECKEKLIQLVKHDPRFKELTEGF